MAIKQKMIVGFLAFGIIASLAGLFYAPTAQAETQKCGDVDTSIIGGDICKGEGGKSTIFNLLTWVLRILTAGVGIAAVGGIGYGALLYTTAEGKPDQTKKAISIITNVVIGIAAYALMAVVLNFLIPGGILQ